MFNKTNSKFPAHQYIKHIQLCMSDSFNYYLLEGLGAYQSDVEETHT